MEKTQSFSDLQVESAKEIVTKQKELTELQMSVQRENLAHQKEVFEKNLEIASKKNENESARLQLWSDTIKLVPDVLSNLCKITYITLGVISVLTLLNIVF